MQKAFQLTGFFIELAETSVAATKSSSTRTTDNDKKNK